ncbi:ABC transporter substrate-binding protein [Paenibacillus sp. NPDC056722]|uniref:ABC transporter substrate-binding protein n=1 Tax=Paenibacillus sp. NPDC056722 TaxID=3345924 RepID=UPI003681A5A2
MHQTERSNGTIRGVHRGQSSFRNMAGLMIILLLTLLVSACGNNTNTGANEKAAASTDASGSAQGNNSSQTESAETLTIKHAYGETKAPTHPKRVAVIGLEDITLSLGVPMVYAYGFDGYYLEDKLKELGIPLSGTADMKPNLEAILAAKPDLILLQQYFTDQSGYDELSKIAPTVPYAPDDWKSSITEIGKITGLEDKAQAVIQANEDKIKQAKETIVSAVGADKTVVYMRPSDKDLQVFFPSFAPLIYEKLGLHPDASVEELKKAATDDWGINTSLEKLPSITADYVFAMYGGSISTKEEFDKEAAATTEVEKLGLWKAMPAVKQNHVFKVSARSWMSSGPIAEGNVIDDVVAAVTGSK